MGATGVYKTKALEFEFHHYEGAYDVSESIYNGFASSSWSPTWATTYDSYNWDDAWWKYGIFDIPAVASAINADQWIGEFIAW